VTFSEYEAATLATIECLREQGVEVSGATPSAGNRLTFEFFTGDAPLAEVRASYQECYEEFAIEVDRAWADANRRTEEELQMARRALADCLRDAGEEVPENPTTEDFVTLQQTAASFGDCSQRVGDEYGIPNFGG
jgi:hypothetical protein